MQSSVRMTGVRRIVIWGQGLRSGPLAYPSMLFSIRSYPVLRVRGFGFFRRSAMALRPASGGRGVVGETPIGGEVMGDTGVDMKI